MQPNFLGRSGHTSPSLVSPLPVTDRFEPDREKIAMLYARLGRRRAEKKIVADLGSARDLVEIACGLRLQGRHAEMAGTLSALRALAGPIGLIPLELAAVAVEGALDGENPHAISATLARLRRVAERALVSVWSYCP